MAHVEEDTNSVYDVIGLGFGPANLAIAGAILEKRDDSPSTQVSHLLAVARSVYLMPRCPGWRGKTFT